MTCALAVTNDTFYLSCECVEEININALLSFIVKLHSILK